MSNQSLRTACLSVALASAWAPVAEGDVLTQINVSSSTDYPLDTAIILMGGRGHSVAVPAKNIPGDALSGLTHLTWVGYSDLATSEFGDSFAVIGLSHGSGDPAFPDLVISNPGLTYIGGISFENAFPGFSEAALIDSLKTDGALAEQFLRTEFAILRQAQGVDASCTAFSSGADFGSISVQAVSVPAPGAGGVLGLAGFIAHRRRRINC